MKKKLSLNNIMHNSRLMLVFSLIAAIVIWACVVYGPSNVITQTIAGVPVSVELTNGYAVAENLRIVGSPDVRVDVRVTGTRSVVGRLNSSTLKLAADTSAVVTAGTHTVGIVVQKGDLDFTVENLSVDTVEIVCDKWIQKTFKVEADASAVKGSDTNQLQLGTPLVESAALTDGNLTLEGPATQMNRIAKLVARVEEEATISDAQVFPAALVALDAEGNEVDLSNCTYVDADSTTPLNVTVPVLVYQKVTFQYTVENMPSYYKKDTFRIEPASIEFWGAPSVVEAFTDQISDLGVFDFDNMKPEDAERTISLNVPDGIKVVGDVGEVKAIFDVNNLKSKTLSVELTLGKNLIVNNQPAGISISPQSTLTNITVCGTSYAIGRISASNLRVVVDMNNASTPGPNRYMARVEVTSRTDVWVYYGDNGENGMEYWITVDNAS